MKVPDALGKFVEALVEPDTAHRCRLLAQATTDDVEVHRVDQTLSGRDQVSNWVDVRLADPEFWLQKRGRPFELNSGWTFEWRIRGSEGDPVDQRVQVTLRDGLVQTARVGPPAPARPGPLQRAAAWGGENPTFMLALLGAAAYAMTRFPIATFYNGLGVTPEEVGFGVDDLVRQSAIMLVLIVLGAGAVTVLYLVLWFPLVNVTVLAQRLRATGEQTRARWVLHGGLSAGLGLPLILFIAGSFMPASVTLPLHLLALALMVVTPQVVRRLPGVPPAWAAVRARQRRSRTEFVNLLPIGGAYFLMIALTLGLPIFAASSADAVKAGGSFNSPVLVWRARPAELLWAKDVTPVKMSEDCGELRYLGRTKEAYAVYDVKLRRAHLVPASSATVTIVERCAG